MKYKRTLAVDADGDIDRDEQGKSYFIEGLRGAEQELRALLSMPEGDQPFAPEAGIDIFEIAGATPAVIRREIRLALRTDDRVKTIDDITIDRGLENFRELTVTVSLTLQTGETMELNEVSIT